jgi:hypothetical protein
MTNKKLPEFLFAVSDADGNRLGLVAYAHGIFNTADAEAYARGNAHEHFETLIADRLDSRPLQIQSLPVASMLEAPATPASLDDVLVDVLYANDCCALTLAELPLASHIRDAEVTCQYCHSTFRYVWDSREGHLIWKWRMPQGTTPRREELVKSLGEVLAFIKSLSENPNDEADQGEDDGADCG